MGPSPDAPWKPEWWREGEDDARAAELLYTLFSGNVVAGLHKSIEDWVVRDNPVAAEAFPHVSFWKELDIRYLRWSCENAEVGEALRDLKAAFGRGEGRMRYVSIDNGGDRSKRARRSAAEQESASHPLQSLR